jgi:hypothetical protein
MNRRVPVLVLMASVLAAPLSGCGLAETGIAAGAGAASEAQQAKDAQKQIDKVQAEVDAAQKKAAETREAALAESEQ